MAVHHARPGSLDINPDVVQVPADRHRGYPGRPSYPPAHHLTDLLDTQRLDRQDLRTGGDPGLPGPGHLDVVRQQPVHHVPPARLIRRRICPGRLVGQLQVHMGFRYTRNATGGWPGSRPAITIRRATVYFSPVCSIRARTCFLNALSSVTPCPSRRPCPAP